MRVLPLLTLPLLASLAVPAVPGVAAQQRDWSTVTASTPAGAYLMGNPAARAKLVEYASYTCSHCADFSRDADAGLKRMLRSGSASWEFRHLIRDPFDLAAAVVARCAGPRGFAATSAAIFAAQPRWLDRAGAFARANGEALKGKPPLTQLRALADGAGLSEIGRANGVTPARLDACFADKAGVDRITAMTAAAPAEVQGTPAFFVNGRFVAGVDWAGLEPVMRTAGAR